MLRYLTVLPRLLFWLGQAGALTLVLCALIQFLAGGFLKLRPSQWGEPVEKASVVRFLLTAAISNYSVDGNALRSAIDARHMLFSPVDCYANRVKFTADGQDRAGDVLGRVNQTLPSWLGHIRHTVEFPRTCKDFGQFSRTTSNIVQVDRQARDWLLHMEYFAHQGEWRHSHYHQVWPVDVKSEASGFGSKTGRFNHFASHAYQLPIEYRDRASRGGRDSSKEDKPERIIIALTLILTGAGLMIWGADHRGGIGVSVLLVGGSLWEVAFVIAARG